MDQLNFETVPAGQCAGLSTDDETIERARVPGGWIVIYDHGLRVGFYEETTPWDSRDRINADTKPDLRLVA